jgi:hypothetical protein
VFREISELAILGFGGIVVRLASAGSGLSVIDLADLGVCGSSTSPRGVGPQRPDVVKGLLLVGILSGKFRGVRPQGLDCV